MSTASEPTVHGPRAYWSKARAALFSGRICAGAFALLQYLEMWIRQRGADNHSISLSERQGAPLAGLDAKTYRKYRRALEDCGLLAWTKERKEGFCWYPRLELPGLFLNGAPAGNFPAGSAGNSPAGPAGKFPAPLYPSGKAPLTETLRPLPNGKEARAGKKSSGPLESDARQTSQGRPTSGRTSDHESRASKGTTLGRHTEKYVMGQLRKTLGPEVMERDGGKWRLRLREDRDKVERVVADIRTQILEGRAIRSRGAYAETLWRMFR